MEIHENNRTESANAVTPERQPLSEAERSVLGAQIMEVLRSCYDPEIPVNIFELGLIYSVDIDDAAFALVTMTLTSPHCPVAQSLPAEIEAKVARVQGISSAKVRIVWDPPWNMNMMSEAAKLELGFM